MTPSGTEHLKETLIGTIFTVSPKTVITTALIYSAIGAVHFILRKPLFEITHDPAAAVRHGRNLFWWDVFFYGTFGIVVTSSVKIAGVLLVFALLVIPSVAGVMSSSRTGVRLAIGWIFSGACGLGGLILAFALNTAAAPMILLVLTVSLALHGLILMVLRR
jgi:zinc/manganese transport system permease protein